MKTTELQIKLPRGLRRVGLTITKEPRRCPWLRITVDGVPIIEVRASDAKAIAEWQGTMMVQLPPRKRGGR